MTVEHIPHIQTPFRIGTYTVYASSSRDVRFTERGAYVPKDLAFHLAPNAWSRLRDVKAASFSRGDHRVQKTQDSDGRAVRYVWWDDMGTLEQTCWKVWWTRLMKPCSEARLSRSVASVDMGGRGPSSLPCWSKSNTLTETQP